MKSISEQDAARLELMPTPDMYDSQVQWGETSEGGTYRMLLNFEDDSDYPFALHVAFSSRDGGGSMLINKTADGNFVAVDDLGRWHLSHDPNHLLPWPVATGWRTRAEPLLRNQVSEIGRH